LRKFCLLTLSLIVLVAVLAKTDVLYASGTATVSGKITDKYSKGPINNARVRIRKGVKKYTAYTNASGTYQINNIAIWDKGTPEPFDIIISKSKYFTKTKALPLKAKSYTKNYILQKTYVVFKGTVTDRVKGTPLKNVKVVMTSPGKPTRTAKTSRAGYYQFGKLYVDEAGSEYTLTAIRDKYFDYIDTLTITPQEEYTQNFTMLKDITYVYGYLKVLNKISGTLKPLPWAKVYLERTGYSKQKRTNSKGLFRFYKVPIDDEVNGTLYTVRVLVDGHEVYNTAHTLYGGVNYSIYEIVTDDWAPAKPTINPVTTPTNLNYQVLTGTRQQYAAIFVNGDLKYGYNVGPDYTAKAWLTEGENALQVVARDRAGNESAPRTCQITYDITPAVINITSFADTLAVCCSSVTIKGTIDDDTAQVEVNGKTATVANGEFEATGITLNTGDNTITAIATDLANNVSQHEISLVRIDEPGNVTEALLPVILNYANISCLKADLTINASYDAQAFGDTDYSRYYYKAPDKLKVETYESSSYSIIKWVEIIDDSTMYLVTPGEGYETVDLPSDAGISGAIYSALNIPYDNASFVGDHNITLDSVDIDTARAILIATPTSQNSLYSKLVVTVDLYKGLILNLDIYQYDAVQDKDVLVASITVDASEFLETTAWVPTVMEKKPAIDNGKVFYLDAIFDNIDINCGLTDDDFDPNGY